MFLHLITCGVQEPEVVDLANFLISCGACIQGAGTNTLTITGTRKLHGTEYQIIPDRIEAGTFLIAAAITRSAISMSPVIPKHLTSVMSKLRAIGCRIQQTRWNALSVCSNLHLLSLVLCLSVCSTLSRMAYTAQWLFQPYHKDYSLCSVGFVIHEGPLFYMLACSYSGASHYSSLQCNCFRKSDSGSY